MRTILDRLREQANAANWYTAYLEPKNLPKRAFLIDEIAARGQVTPPTEWEPELLAYREEVKRGVFWNDGEPVWFEWGSRACLVAPAKPPSGSRYVFSGIDDISEATPETVSHRTVFVPYERIGDDAYVHGTWLAIQGRGHGHWSWCTWERSLLENELGIRIGGDVTDDEKAVEAAWNAFAAIVLTNAEGISIRQHHESPPERWARRYEKRRGFPPTERIRLFLDTTSTTESERHHCFRYTRSHEKFYSGEPGHRFFGRAEPYTQYCPGFWSGNPELGISLNPIKE